MKKVLFTVHIETHFIELLRVARLLKQSGEYDPIFLFQSTYPTFETDLAICRAEGLKYVGPASTDVKPSSTSIKPDQKEKNQRWRRPSLDKLPSILRFLILTFRMYKLYRHEARKMNDLLKEYKPILLVLPEDDIAYKFSILIKLGRLRGIPTVIVPFTIVNSTERAEYYYDLPHFRVSSSLGNRLIGFLYPHWVYSYKGHKLLFMSAVNILALELLGLAPRKPWVKCSEETSVIAVENESMYQYYRNENIPVERLFMTGALYDDVLAQNQQDIQLRRADLYQELDLPLDRPLLLCALPPNQFPRECEFKDYEQMINFWMKALSDISDWNVIVRPHPRLTEKEIEAIKSNGIRITQRDTASLIPLCDLYVASISATIRWAIACGKPVVNYDVYQYGFRDYKEIKGVIAVNDKSSFLATLRRLTMEPDYYEQTASFQRESMPRWGNLDGKSGERMLQLFHKVINTV